VQNKKHQRKNAKHTQNRKYQKNKKIKNRTASQIGQLLALAVIFKKNIATAPAIVVGR
jgi:hypothetical protein